MDPLLLIQTVADMMPEHVLDWVGASSPGAVGIAYYFGRRELRALKESRQYWKTKAEEAEKALINYLEKNDK